jgi:hypothetical protein
VPKIPRTLKNPLNLLLSPHLAGCQITNSMAEKIGRSDAASLSQAGGISSHAR